MALASLRGLQSQTVCVSGQSEERALVGLEGPMALLTIANDTVNADMQKTIQVFEQFKEDSQAKNGALVRINETLLGQFVQLESRLKENEELYQRNLAAITQERDALRQEVTLLRQNMAAVTSQAEQRVAAETAARVEEVRVATLAGEERVRIVEQREREALQWIERMRAEFEGERAALKAEKDLGIQAAHQERVAQVAAAGRQAEAVRQEALHEKALADEIEWQMKDTNQMWLCFDEVLDAYLKVKGTYHSYLITIAEKPTKDFREFIKERMSRPKKLVFNKAIQENDNKKLQELIVPLMVLTQNSLVEFYLGPALRTFQQKILKLIADRKLR